MQVRVFIALAGLIAAAMPVRAEQCIVPTAQIRRAHPDLLKHQRDLTVHRGQRGAAASLDACINCHAAPENQHLIEALRTRLYGATPTGAAQANRAAKRFAADQGAAFCQTCHSYAAVKLDCFECHAQSPRVAQGASKP